MALALVEPGHLAPPKTRVLMGVTAFSIFANAFFDYIFSRLWQGIGIAVATSAVYFCTMCILFYVLQCRIGKLNLLTPPSELSNVLEKIGLASQLESSWFGIPYKLRQEVIRIGLILALFAIGIFGVLQNGLYMLRTAFGSIVVLAFLRYRYALLIAWILVDVFIGSSIQFFQGNNIDTGLTIPTLLLMTCMPIGQAFRRMRPLLFLLIYFLWVFASIGIPVLAWDYSLRIGCSSLIMWQWLY